MPDTITFQSNAPATPPEGTVVATDQVTIGGVLQQVQRIKLVAGQDGETDPIEGSAAQGLEVDVTRVQGVVHVDDNGVALTVDGTVVLGPSTATIGKLGANSGTDIGDVDVTSLPSLPPGTNTIGKVDVNGPVGTTNASADASLAIMDDWDENDRAKVNPIEGAIGVAGGSGADSATTQRVSLATNVALPAGTNLIGNTSAGLRTDVLYAPAGATLTPKFAPIAVGSSGNTTVVAAVASKKIRVLSLYLVAAGTVNVTWQYGPAGAALTGAVPLVANAGYVLPFNPCGWFESTSGGLLGVNLSAAVAIAGALSYVEV